MAGVQSIVASLDEREAEIIRLRFGLAGGSEMTLEEVGQKFNVTRERIRQIEQLALIKLRRLLAEHESQRTPEDIDRENHRQKRLEALRNYIDSKAAQPAGLS
jgi:RNA polymerase primary sigma factor